MLTEEHLERFEEALRRAGAPFVDHLRPGLTPDQVRALTAPFEGLSLPQELLTWFGWHNGASDRGVLSPKRLYLSLQEVLEDHLALLRIGAGPAHRSLLPITNERPLILVECVPESPTVGRVFVEYFAEAPEPALASVGELIEIWTAYLEKGIWRYVDGVPNWDAELIESRSNPVDGTYL